MNLVVENHGSVSVDLNKDIENIREENGSVGRVRSPSSSGITLPLNV